MSAAPFRQLAFDLPHRPAMGRDDFFVSPANRQALAVIERWPEWPHPVLILLGEVALAAVWRQASRARLVEARALAIADAEAVSGGGALIVENADAGIASEQALFHAINLAREAAGSVLLSARLPVAHWPVALADLRSRLQAAPSVPLAPPDDLLLQAVLSKLFADRQIAVNAPLIAYTAARMRRSLGAAARVVEAIDRLSLAEKRDVNRALVRRVLAGEAAAGERS